MQESRWCFWGFVGKQHHLCSPYRQFGTSKHNLAPTRFTDRNSQGHQGTPIEVSIGYSLKHRTSRDSHQEGTMAEFGAYGDCTAVNLYLESAAVVTVETKIARGGLAPWQMRRATELLRGRLDGDVSLSELAAECKISVSHFARSFKQAIGQTPHRWLVHRRVDAAKNLMLHSGMRLSEIAVGCGFADQTSFNRTFKKIAGITPGDWRRSCSSSGTR
jgi:AraC-like DNA-binding protein